MCSTISEHVRFLNMVTIKIDANWICTAHDPRRNARLETLMTYPLAKIHTKPRPTSRTFLETLATHPY